MTKIADIHRHPVKGWTPESLEQVELNAGSGLPFDRHFAFTNGRRDELPKAGAWVQARTFLQLTFFPELAAFRSVLDAEGLLTLTAPDGSTAQAQAGTPESFEAANGFIRRHFENGPFGPPTLYEQAPGLGHWDFTDTCISIINLATVEAIEEAAGRPLKRERFTGNLYIDGLEPRTEFDWPGRVITVGDVKIEILRPVQRCAMTSTEPGTGIREFDLPAIMNETFGHNFCGVYGRVVSGGSICKRDNISCGDDHVLEPYTILPERVAPPALWPRLVQAEPDGHRLVKLAPAQPGWPLLAAESGQAFRVLARAQGETRHKAKIVEGGPDGYVCRCERPFAAGEPILISGPLGRAS